MPMPAAAPAGTRAKQPGALRLMKTLQEYNRQRQQEAFEREAFECAVCCACAPGARCVQFQPCGHVFCKRCVRDYVEVAIREGRVQNLCCLALDCRSPVTQAHVRELVSSELFASYDQLLLAVSLSAMADVVYCPFASCETPVVIDVGDDMASCPACKYAFCVHCRAGYHGVEPCRIRTKDKLKLVREYLSAGAQRKEELERRYGRRPLQILANNVMSQQWIDTHSKPCPKCGANIEKQDGCNKMQCWRCAGNFCWICGKLITDKDPYLHFSTATSKCNGLLFHGLPAEAYEFAEEELVGEEDDYLYEEDSDDGIYFDINAL